MEGNSSRTGSNQGLKKVISEDEDVAQSGKLPDEGGSRVNFQHCTVHACNASTRDQSSKFNLSYTSSLRPAYFHKVLSQNLKKKQKHLFDDATVISL